MEMGGQHHTPTALPLEMTWYPLCRGLGGPHSQSGQMQKISPPTGIWAVDSAAHSELLY
jgi:hypothetical protein